MIFEGAQGSTGQTAKAKVSFDNIQNWTHIFTRHDVQKKAPKLKVKKEVGKVMVRGEKSVTAQWETAITNARLPIGNGAIFVYRSELGQDSLHTFLDFLNDTQVRQGKFVALVNLSSKKVTGDLRPLLRTFQQEAPQMLTFSLEINNTLALSLIHI